MHNDAKLSGLDVRRKQHVYQVVNKGVDHSSTGQINNMFVLVSDSHDISSRSNTSEALGVPPYKLNLSFMT